MNEFDRVRRIADAVLFEGYALYPYRPTSAKNRLRWQFGVLAPREWSDACAERSWMEAQCLVEIEDRALDVTVGMRFLHVRRRRIELDGGAGWSAVSALEFDGRLHVPWDEADVREIAMSASLGAGDEERRAFELGGSIAVERLGATPKGEARIVREQRTISGELRLSAERVAPRLVRLRVRLENTTSCAAVPRDRDEALAVSLVSAHIMIRADGGAFVSLLDPPDWASEAAGACKNVGCYPVLAGEPGSRDLVLAAPMILYDHPAVAPESPGDLFDATEIDEILTLRTRSLTADEKRWARATDERVAALLDRVDRLSPEQLERMHGAVREPAAPRTLRIGNIVIGPGSRVRLHPGARRTDAQDMFLRGMAATVHEVLRDVDDRDCVAVSLDDDPAAELLLAHGRYLYFRPDEIEPLDRGGDAP